MNNEGITFDDELAMWSEGIDPGDHAAVPVAVDEDETTPLPVESMAAVVFGIAVPL